MHDMNPSTGSHPYVVPMSTNPKAALSTLHELSLETVRTEVNDDVPNFALEAMQYNENKLWSSNLAASAIDDPNVKEEIHPTESAKLTMKT